MDRMFICLQVSSNPRLLPSGCIEKKLYRRSHKMWQCRYQTWYMSGCFIAELICDTQGVLAESLAGGKVSKAQIYALYQGINGMSTRVKAV